MSADPRIAQRPRDLVRAKVQRSTNLVTLTDDLSTLYFQEVDADGQIDPDLRARMVEAVGALDDSDWWTIVTELWPYEDMGQRHANAHRMESLRVVLSWIDASPVLNPWLDR